MMASPACCREERWLAVFLLIAPWLLTIFLGWPHFRHGPGTALALLPGLAVALLLLHQLHHYLGCNHRPGEGERIFSSLGAANWITLLRGSAIVGLAGFFPLALALRGGLHGPLAWAPGLIYLGVSVADLVDGLVARKQGRETELGKRLDISTDAAGLLVASLLAVALGQLPGLYLLVGLAYYPFVFGIWLRQRRGLPVVALQPRPYARIIAGFQMGLVGVALLPVFSPSFTFIAAIIFMMPLLAGFLRDWLVVSCRMQTDACQQTAWDGRAATMWTRVLPLVLRLVVLMAGGMALVDRTVFPAGPSWPGAYSACCLLAGLGFMGRTAGLVLALLLGIHQAPTGVDANTMLVFGSAVLLMLTGTGGLSIWSPEEAFLYRRKACGPSACGKNP